MSSQIKLVAFDMGGVMVRTDEEVPTAEFSRISGRTREDVFEAVFSPERKQGVETGQISASEHARQSMDLLHLDLDDDDFWRIHVSSHMPDSTVGEMVQSVSSEVPIAIASNLPEPHWEWAKRNLSYWQMFSVRVLSFEIGVMKPDRSFFDTLVRMSGLKADEIFFVDDSEQNVESAAAVGIQASVFTDHASLSANLRRVGVAV